MPVQIDGKTRFRVQVPAAAQRDEIAAVVTAHPEYARWTQDVAVARLERKFQNLVRRLVKHPKDESILQDFAGLAGGTAKLQHRWMARSRVTARLVSLRGK